MTTQVSSTMLEGVCAVCRQKVSDHVGKGGRWIGCGSGVNVGSRPLILVPDRRKRPRKQTTEPYRSPYARQAEARQPHVAYAARYALNSPEVRGIVSERDLGVYKAIKRSRFGLTAKLVATELGLPSSRGAVESSLQRLTAANLVEKVWLDMDLEK